MKATLVFWHKDRRPDGLILELKIHEVGISTQYPDGVKYSLICKDLKSGRQVLMDNHHPKGHHVHLDGEETIYSFKGLDALVDDFSEMVSKHLGVTI